MKIFAAHNPKTEIRKQSSSGGIFSILAETVLQDGGVVYGAAYDTDWNVTHQRIDSIKGLSALRGSKYVYSRASEAYSMAISDLESGRRVLFSGTPCQIAALHKRAGENPNLLLVEVVCHGAPLPEYWNRYLSELCQKQNKTIGDIVSINFRDKRNGWRSYNFTVTYKDGSEYSEFHGANAYMKGFLFNYTLREPCFKCPFKYPTGSKADISLGDFWGISKIAPEIPEETGVSLIIARTISGEDAMSGLKKAGIFDFEKISILNPALTAAAKRPDNYDSATRLLTKSISIIDTLEAITRTPLSIRVKIFIASILKKFIKSAL